MKKFVSLLITVVFVFSILVTGYVWHAYVNQPASNQSEEVVYEVAPGVTFRSVAKDMQQKGLLRSAEFFVILAKIKRVGNKMKVGEYALNRNMTPNEILNVIISGKSIEKKITIAEGLSIYEIADIFDGLGLSTREEFLRLVTDPELIKSVLGENHDSLEGYLFPETYSFTKYTDVKNLVIEMVKKFQDSYKEIEAQSQISGLSKHQIVTLASIVEKETGASEERPLISSVFHNRLKKGMRLQTDPTVIYGKAKLAGRLEMNITKFDLTTPTAYNTYTNGGLPPGPIANPGKEALLAAVRPAESEYFFFVSHNDGTHEFTKEYRDHQKAVQSFQQNKSAREGKSWRNLKKKK